MPTNKILKNSGWLILSILSLMPLLFWILELPLNLRFLSLPLTSRSLSDIFGLCGMAMFSLVMILSARLKFFEKFFNGINQSYTAHHFFGGLTFCLLLFHPLFLFWLAPSFSSWPINFGIAGLFVMISALVITFYTKLKYQAWKFTHKFLGIAFIFAFLHTFLIGGNIATNPLLKTYLFVLGVLAILAYFYRTLFADYFVRVFDYTINQITQQPDKVWEIEFRPKNKEIEFAAGQFAFVKIYSNGLTNESHPFSFSSAPGKALKIAIKELGDYTNKISNLEVGDLAKIEGPFGSFNFQNYADKNQIWIAGGIGITPFLSMLRDMGSQHRDYKIDLYYSVKKESCLVFKEELQKIAGKYKNINIIFWVTENKGFLTADLIKAGSKNLKQCDILICGPGPMMLALKKQFLQRGIKKNKIHAEEFQLY